MKIKRSKLETGKYYECFCGSDSYLFKFIKNDGSYIIVNYFIENIHYKCYGDNNRLIGMYFNSFNEKDINYIEKYLPDRHPDKLAFNRKKKILSLLNK